MNPTKKLFQLLAHSSQRVDLKPHIQGIIYELTREQLMPEDILERHDLLMACLSSHTLQGQTLQGYLVPESDDRRELIRIREIALVRAREAIVLGVAQKTISHAMLNLRSMF